MASPKGEAIDAAKAALIEAHRRGAAATNADDVFKAADDAARARARIHEIGIMGVIRHHGG